MFADTEDIAKVFTVRSNNELQLFGKMMTFYSNALAFNYLFSQRYQVLMYGIYVTLLVATILAG